MKRFLPLAILALLVIAGFGSGTLINQVGVRYALSVPEGETPVNMAKAVSTSASKSKRSQNKTHTQSDAQYLSQILARNIFDPDAIGMKPVITNGDDISDLKVILQATMVAIPAHLSVAFIAEDTPDAYPLGYGIGEKVLNAQIVAIEVGRVQIRKPDGKLEYLVLHREPTPKRPGRATAARSTGDDNITKEDETHFTVSRELLDKHLGNIAGISKLGRARPHKGSDGKVDGYRLSGIRRGTVGEKLGIKNGDIVHGVNGFNLNSMSEAMNAFQDLQNQPHFTFEVTRRGQKTTLNYDVR